MTESEVLARVSQVIQAETGRTGPFGPDTHLVDGLGLDSLALLSITVELENRFELCLEPEEGEALERIGDIVGLLMRMSREAERESA